MAYSTIDTKPLDLEVRLNYVIVERLVMTNLAGLVMNETTGEDEIVQNGVIVGRGFAAEEQGLELGTHILYKRPAGIQFRFLGRKLVLLFSSEIFAIKLDRTKEDKA